MQVHRIENAEISAITKKNKKRCNVNETTLLKPIEIISQCSTIVSNTVLRATIKVNGKHLILGTVAPKPPNQSI